jgi:flagellar hook-associated protein 1 FlgK
MSKIYGIMDTGKRSMANSQTALQTVGHNIANKSTEGFSRQRVELQTSEAIGLGKLRIGTGAKTAAVTRVNNSYLEKQIGNEQGKLGYIKGKNDAMGRVEQVFNEQSNKGLNTFMGEFFNSFREFASNPESLATRTQVKETADFLTKDFKRVTTQLKEIQKDADQQITTLVHDVNEHAGEIARLNKEIQMVQNAGGPANDERDRRDLMIKQLGEKINIKWAEGEDGTVTVSAGNSAILVAGYDAKRLEARGTPETETKGEGNVDIFYYNKDTAEPMKVTEQLTGGSIGGLLEIRDKTIGQLLNNNDQMAYALATSVNELHQQGVDAYNKQGVEFFEQPGDIKHAAENLRLSDAVLKDVGHIAAAATFGAPGDNRVANKISQLQYQNILGSSDAAEENGNSASLDEFYNSMVGRVGIQSKRAQTAQESQNNILKNLQNIRESISGVSLDEETTKLIEFQKSFDASARLIRTADEMFDTVLGLKR